MNSEMVADLRSDLYIMGEYILLKGKMFFTPWHVIWDLNQSR